MNILFLTIGEFRNLDEGSVHKDVVKYLASLGHNLYVACKNEDNTSERSFMTEEQNIKLLHIRTGSLKKTSNSIRKGISTLLLERSFINAIKHHYSGIKFDLVLYHTPPVTFANVVHFVKKRDNAASYLLLKDIFPQNAVDLGLLTTNGIKGIAYKYFRQKEKALYRESDYIGCMSPANVDYLLSHNPYLDPSHVEVAPNSVLLEEIRQISQEEKYEVRVKYNLPLDKRIFIYGGNLGKPQGVPFIVKCLSSFSGRDNCHFLIVGSGADQHLIQDWFDSTHPQNVTLIGSLPKEEYEALVQTSDVGLIFLDNRFTIPNYPSRLLSYLQSKKPVLIASDSVSDVGPIAQENGYGVWCRSDSVEAFSDCAERLLNENLIEMGEKGYQFLFDNYQAKQTCETVLKHFIK